MSDMPPDPFAGGADLTPFATNCRNMYTALLATGFKETEAMEIMIRVTCAFFTKAILWDGTRIINMCGGCSIMLCGWLKVKGSSVCAVRVVRLGGGCLRRRRLRQVSIARSHVGPSVRLSAIVVRACSECQGKRELGKPCATCGNMEPPKVTDLGVIASHQKNRWTRLKWNLWGFHVAQHRIRKTNKEMLRSCGE